MRKFTFRKNNSKTTGKAAQEKFVNEYFGELDLSKEPVVNTENDPFDPDAIYSRIVNAIDN